MKTYDLVKQELENDEKSRSSDRRLLLRVWYRQGIISRNVDNAAYFININDFMEKAVPAESITRARRKVQENHPHLQANEKVEAARREKEKKKGYFVYHEQVMGKAH